MSYEIEIRSTYVMVRLLGHVAAQDLLTSHEEQAFMLGIEDTGTVIYDYSRAESVQLSERDVDSLAKLAEHIARFQSPMTIIIVPRDPANTQLAEAYCATITSDSVRAHVALTTAQALQLAEA